VKDSDFAQFFSSTENLQFRCLSPQSSSSHRSNKSDSAKDAQIARFKERVRQLEAQVRSLKEENELLYGKLIDL
jgi:cell division protein FtsB